MNSSVYLAMIMTGFVMIFLNGLVAQSRVPKVEVRYMPRGMESFLHDPATQPLALFGGDMFTRGVIRQS
jgi:hypothetical protein